MTLILYQMKTIQKLVFAFFAFTLIAGPAFAAHDDNFDPFAAPPKNLKSEDANRDLSMPQSNVAIPVEIDASTIGKIDDTHYSGTLEDSDRVVDGYFTYSLNIGEGKVIPLNTKKDIADLVGEKIIIEIERTAGGPVLTNITVVSDDGKGGQILNLVNENDLPSAATGPRTSIIIPFVFLVLAGLVAAGVFTHKGVFTARKEGE